MQKEDKAVVQGVINDITDFSEAVNDVMSRLKTEAQNMADVWKDAQYNQFITCIEELDAGIKKDLQELGEAQQELSRRLAMYD